MGRSGGGELWLVGWLSWKSKSEAWMFVIWSIMLLLLSLSSPTRVTLPQQTGTALLKLLSRSYASLGFLFCFSLGFLFSFMCMHTQLLFRCLLMRLFSFQCSILRDIFSECQTISKYCMIDKWNMDVSNAAGKVI